MDIEKWANIVKSSLIPGGGGGGRDFCFTFLSIKKVAVYSELPSIKSKIYSFVYLPSMSSAFNDYTVFRDWRTNKSVCGWVFLYE